MKITTFISPMLSVSFSLLLVYGTQAQGLSDALRLRITDNNTGAYDETVIRFHQDATTGWDGNYDAHKLFSSSTAVPSLFTRTEGGWDLSINAYPELKQDYDVPLYLLSSQGGSFTLSYEVLGAFDASTYIAVKQASTGNYLTLDQLPLSFSVTGGSDTLEAFQLTFSIPPVVTVLTQPCPEAATGVIALTDVGNLDFNYELIDGAGQTFAQAGSISGSTIIESIEPDTYELHTSSTTGETNITEVVIEATPEVVLNEVIQSSSCDIAEDGAIELEATDGEGPFTVSWSHNTSDAWVLSDLVAGEYHTTVLDARGCTFEFDHHVSADQPELAVLETASGQITFEQGENVTFMNTAADAEWSSWSVNGLTLQGATVDNVFDKAGTFEVELTGHMDVCHATERLEVSIEEVPVETPLGSEEAGPDAEVSVWYTSGQVWISLPESSHGKMGIVQICDMLGKEIGQHPLQWNGNRALPIDQATAGVYIAHITTDGLELSRKFMIH